MLLTSVLKGGDLGSNVVASGTPEQIAAYAGSYTQVYRASARKVDIL